MLPPGHVCCVGVQLVAVVAPGDELVHDVFVEVELVRAPAELVRVTDAGGVGVPAPVTADPILEPAVRRSLPGPRRRSPLLPAVVTDVSASGMTASTLAGRRPGLDLDARSHVPAAV